VVANSENFLNRDIFNDPEAGVVSEA
jgi:hypothetical protein